MPDKKIILTDVDGVILDWHSAFNVFAKSLGYEFKKTDRYFVSDTHNVSEKRADAMVELFNTSPTFGRLSAFNRAEDVIGSLYREHDFRFIAITTAGINSETVRLRKENLITLFGGAFIDFYVIGEKEDKKDYLKKFKGSGYSWLEDLPSNAAKGLDLGLKPILFSRPYNRDFQHEKISRVFDWDDAKKIILSNPKYI